MATWTTSADARLEPDNPARSIDAIALRDNPVAIAENAPNAPKVNQYYLLITTSTTWTVPKTGQYQIDIVGGGSNGTAGAAGAAGTAWAGGGTAGAAGAAGGWAAGVPAPGAVAQPPKARAQASASADALAVNGAGERRQSRGGVG